MTKVRPNDICPCGLDYKFKKCCGLYLEGAASESAERLLRVRYVASVVGDAEFLWRTLHPQSPRKLKDRHESFIAEQKLLKGLEYQSLKLLDSVKKKGAVFIAHYVTVYENGQDLSYVEEAQFNLFEEAWYYMDGIRRSSSRIGCVPESLKVGELATLYVHSSGHN